MSNLNIGNLVSAVMGSDQFCGSVNPQKTRHVVEVAINRLGLASLEEPISLEIGNGFRLLVRTLGEKEPDPFDFLKHLKHQREWSEQTFGPGDRTEGVVDHIRKELNEVLTKPSDITEWIDVVILALDGAWRSGHSPEAIIAALVAKQAKNESRQWPDWRTAEPGKAIEHVRSDGEGS